MSIAPALSVLCMSLRGQDAHLQVATLLQAQDVWWDVVQFIAPTLSAVHRDPPDFNEWRGPPISCRTFVGCVHAMSVSIRNVAQEDALCIVPALIVHSTAAQMAGEAGNPVRGGPVIPNAALSIGTFQCTEIIEWRWVTP